MHDETPGTLVLTGPFCAADAEMLTQYCRRLSRSGQLRVVLDVGGVTHCDLAGMRCWRALMQHECGLAVILEGARWSQFLGLLRLTAIDDLSHVCNEIRSLVPSAPSHPAPGPRTTRRRSTATG